MHTVSRRVADKAVLSVCFHMGWGGEIPRPNRKLHGKLVVGLKAPYDLERPNQSK